jgi:hypothetical protein
MWHKSTGSTIGATFKADIDEKYFDDIENGLDVRYHNLVDESGNVVGKVFNDLKLFVIEDQDLLFALSYKSNRSWTLPNFSVEIVGTQTVCATCDIIIKNIVYTPPANYYSQATYSFNVDYLSEEANGYVIVEGFSGGTSTSGGTSVYMKRLSPDIITGKYVFSISSGNYSRFEVRDIGVPDCVGFIDGRNIIQPTPTMTPTMTLTPTPTPTPVAVQFSLYIDTVSGGTTTPASGVMHYYNSGASATVSTTPSLYYSFDRWIETISGNLISLNQNIVITMNGDKRIKPVYTYNGLSKPTIVIDNDETYSATDSIKVFTDVTSDGGASVNSRGVVWSTTNPSPTIGGSGCTYTNIGSGTGAMTTIIPSLSADTTYYIAGFATNTQGTSYSQTITASTAQIQTTFSIEWMFNEISTSGAFLIRKNGTIVVNTTYDSSGTVSCNLGDSIQISCNALHASGYATILLNGEMVVSELGYADYHIDSVNSNMSVEGYVDLYQMGIY